MVLEANHAARSREERRKTDSPREMAKVPSCGQYPLVYCGGLCGNTHESPPRQGVGGWWWTDGLPDAGKGRFFELAGQALPLPLAGGPRGSTQFHVKSSAKCKMMNAGWPQLHTLHSALVSILGAGRENRTLMVLPPRDFESRASTNSAIPALSSLLQASAGFWLRPRLRRLTCCAVSLRRNKPTGIER